MPCDHPSSVMLITARPSCSPLERPALGCILSRYVWGLRPSFARPLTFVVGPHVLDLGPAGLLGRCVCMVDFDIVTFVSAVTCGETLAGSYLACGFIAKILCLCQWWSKRQISQVSAPPAPGPIYDHSEYVHVHPSRHIRSSSGTTSTLLCTLLTDLQWLLLRVSTTIQLINDTLTNSRDRTTTPFS